MTDKEQQLYKDRVKKLEALKKAGLDTYPATAHRTHTIAEVLQKFESLAKQKKKVSLTGRIRAIRAHGALAFGNLEDESGSIQFMLKEDDLGKEKFDIFTKFFDIGDFLQGAGELIETKRREKTLVVSDYQILTKSLKALPEKWHGLTDEETRLRKRYLDMIAHPNVRDMFRKKNIFWQAVRQFLAEKGFLEVQTPVLENIPGGADAEPFVTHHNALDRDFYLRISLELPLKRLLVGGFDRVFEIGRLFRNEGMDREHLQEYDDMEFYMAYADHETGMELVEQMFKKIVNEVVGTIETTFAGHRLDWGKKWPRVDYFEALKKESNIDLAKNPSAEELKKQADKLGLKYDPAYGKGRMIDTIYKQTVRDKLIQPCFLVGHPIEISPLAKIDPKDSKKVLRFQVVAGGTELGNGWSELNSPIEQRSRFEQQMKLREGGDKEAQMMDEDFVEALEYGMPPAVGFGLSERLFAVLMDKSIRETVIFPPMKEVGKNRE
ncbi:MAG: lysine--tRNA ligase [bacterium]|nr:lysine--tRNA ligase [bacterium]